MSTKSVLSENRAINAPIDSVNASNLTTVNTNLAVANDCFYAEETDYFRINELKKLKSKQFWMKKFIKSYKLPCHDIKPEFFQSNSIYIQAKYKGAKAGFVRLTNRDDWYRLSAGEKIYNLSDACTLGSFRGRGTYKKLLDHVVENYNTHSVCLHDDMFEKYEGWYAEKGFTYPVFCHRNALWYLLDSYAWERLKQRPTLEAYAMQLAS